MLYVYDHCPFCVRVRAVFGLKNIKHNLFFLANDDVITPTNLIGKKISPIYEWKSSGICMPESLDIIANVDNDDRMGPTEMILPATGRDDLKAWQSSVRDLLRGLQRPRYVATGLLPEFQQLDGRIAFIKNHEMVGYTKDEWKKSDPPMSIEQKIEVYNTAFQKDPATDIEELNRKLIELDDIIYCEHYVTDVTPNSHGNCISIDDIDLFARLRSITIIKNVIWPAKLRNYMDYMSQLTDIPLYDAMAM
jgi:glutaredoxin 2